MNVDESSRRWRHYQRVASDLMHARFRSRPISSLLLDATRRRRSYRCCICYQRYLPNMDLLYKYQLILQSYRNLWNIKWWNSMLLQASTCLRKENAADGAIRNLLVYIISTINIINTNKLIFATKMLMISRYRESLSHILTFFWNSLASSLLRNESRSNCTSLSAISCAQYKRSHTC